MSPLFPDDIQHVSTFESRAYQYPLYHSMQGGQRDDVRDTSNSMQGGQRDDVRDTSNLGSDNNPDNEVFNGPVPRERLTVTFSRSSGPGGQNVNKLNTKVEVRFHVQSADWIPKRVKRRVESMYRNRITKSGELVITSQRHRTQRKNLEDAVLRLDGILSEASELPKGPSQLTVARIKALRRKADKQRRTDKKYRSEKKLNRKTFPTD